jgi:hypothetical protein
MTVLPTFQSFPPFPDVFSPYGGAQSPAS